MSTLSSDDRCPKCNAATGAKRPGGCSYCAPDSIPSKQRFSIDGADGAIMKEAFKVAEPSKTNLQQAWDFLSRVATYFDYTHDDVDELKILYELQAAAKAIYGEGLSDETPEQVCPHGIRVVQGITCLCGREWHAPKASEPLTCDGACRYAGPGQFVRDPNCSTHGTAQNGG
jgi:hypothetical protein